MQTLEEVLAHHGIKGMHWGVRRARGADGRVTGSSAKPHASEDAKKASEIHTRIKSGGLHAVSNPELQHLVNRMNLEQQFKRLDGQKKSNAAKFVQETLVQVGKQQASRLAAEGLTKAVGAALKK